MKTAQTIATDLFNRHYAILFDSDSDYSEEIIVSVLAIKHAVLTCEAILDLNKFVNINELYTEVKNILLKM